MPRESSFEPGLSFPGFPGMASWVGASLHCDKLRYFEKSCWVVSPCAWVYVRGNPEFSVVVAVAMCEVFVLNMGRGGVRGGFLREGNSQ